ncbi:MAG: HDIG domain-containing protein [Candidatus Zixiibacteriota bacterium]|nr:MAG: HDIG domain-containing protein [candidate division Zixibacteria bacterium]
MKDDLLRLFPEIGQIRDENLRSKTLETLVEAVQLGGWTPGQLDDIPFTLLIKDTRVSFVQHTRTVTQTALACARLLAEQYGAYFHLNMDYLVAGGILHDVGKLLEYRKIERGYAKSPSGKLLRHPFSGAGLCTKHGLPDEVVHIVAVHAKEGDSGYRSPEAIIVHHADFINFEPLRDL